MTQGSFYAEVLTGVGLFVALAVVVALNFICYWLPTRFMLRSAGVGPLPFRYYLQGFLGQVAIGLLIGGAVYFVFSVVAKVSR